ncbi:PTS sugar transporter subunit IIA, partial [Streptococcus agalactiae]
MIEKLIYNDLISLNHRYRDQTNLLEVLSQYLLQKGYVKTEFSKAILQREKDYPTGLQLENMAVAIPHTY